MDAKPLCGAPTMAGGSCRWKVGECKHASHARWRAANPCLRGSMSDHGVTLSEVPDAVAEHDLYVLSWWLVERVIAGDLETARASVVATVMRVLLALGREPLDEEERFSRAELMGQLMHGVPPADEAEWVRARAILTPDALVTVEGWADRYGWPISPQNVPG